MPKSRLKTKPLKTLFSYLKPYPKHLAGALVAMLVAALAVLAIGQGIKLLVNSGFSDLAVDKRARGAWALLLISFLMAIASFFRYYLVAWLGERLVADIRQHFFSHVLSQDATFFGRKRTSDLSARLITDTTVIQNVVSGAIPIAARNAILFTGGFIMLWVTSAKLAASILLLIPLVLLPLILFGRYVRTCTRHVQEQMAEANIYAEETFSNVKTVQAFNHTPQDIKNYNRVTGTVFQTAIKRNLFRGLLSSSVIAFVFSAIVWMVWQGGEEVVSGRISGGDMAAFVFYALITASSVNALSELYGELQKAAAAAERIFSVLEEHPSITSPQNPKPLPSGPYTLSLENVTFRYPNSSNAVLNNVSLKCQANQLTALSGISGRGKSTVFALLLRFYDPQVGEVLLNGINIKEFDLAAYRQLFAFVSQDAPLFSINLMDNIRYGEPDADLQAVQAVAKQAEIHDHIMSLPQQYQAMIGEKGTELSGGQRQRLALARALLCNAPIILLDEVTSALDQGNEHHILEMIRTQTGKTRIIISHKRQVAEMVDQTVTF